MMQSVRVLLAVASAGAWCGVCAAGVVSSGPVMYFSGETFPGGSAAYGTVNSSIAGTNVSQVLATTSDVARPMGVTVANGYMYWASYQPGEIWRADLSGQGATRLYASGSNTSYTRHIELFQNKMYWNEEGPGVIKRANLDGSSVETVISGYPGNGSSQGIWDFAVANNRIYWTSWHNNRVFTTNLVGGDVQQFLVGGQRTFTLDSFAGGLVFSSQNDLGPSGPPNQIIRTNFDGSSPTVLAELPLATTSELLDVSIFGDRAYYAWRGSANSVISSVALAGGASRVEMSVPYERTLIFQLDVVPAPGVGVMVVSAGVLGACRRRRRCD